MMTFNDSANVYVSLFANNPFLFVVNVKYYSFSTM